jgi:hypothetical protein
MESGELKEIEKKLGYKSRNGWLKVGDEEKEKYLNLQKIIKHL